MTSSLPTRSLPDLREEPAATPSLYVHVPFCVVKCGYCDFTSYEIADGAAHQLYLERLETELALLEPPRVPHTVFLGGGTPTYLSPARFERLLEIVGTAVDLRRVSEVSLEANPESLDATKARLAYVAGVRRASMGVQSFDAERLRFLDRPHDGDDVRRGVEVLRAAGFENLSLDLIFGTPGQTVAQWHADLDAALELEPDHLSCYSLTFEPGTRLERDRARGRVTPLDEALDAELFLATRERLEAAGFVAYEVSNFAGRGGPSFHNDHYWLQGDYLGAGPGASSHLAGWRGTNLRTLHSWAHSVERGLLPTGEAEQLTRATRLGEALWLGLRRHSGVSADQISSRVDTPVTAAVRDRLAGWQRTGHLELDTTTSRWRLTPAGLLLADSVTASFLDIP